MYLAIDIGATKTLIGLFSPRGRKVKTLKFTTNHDQKKFSNTLSEKLKGFKKYDVKTVVIAVPGVVQKNCSVKFGNLPWKNIRLDTLLKQYFSCPIYIKNDADLSTIFESHRRNGLCVFLTLSTGIGGGIAKDGEIVANSGQFEPGHDFYVFRGKPTEWEDIVSAKAVKTKYRTLSSEIYDSKALDDIAHRLSLGLTDIINEYHPDCIILGGPLGAILPRYKKYLKQYLSPLSPLPKFVKAKRPAESVIYGCYLYAKSKN